MTTYGPFRGHPAHARERLPALDDCQVIVGDEVSRIVEWKKGPNTSDLAGKPVRMRVKMRDADLYSFRFQSRLAEE